jgi:HTH-type transcriptional regulator/antitoxin HigA
MKKKKIAAHEMIAGDVFVPGEYILDELAARNMKQVDLANDLGLSKSEMSLIIHGKRSITVPIAIKLEKVFEIDAEFWMNLQVKYDIEKLKMEYARDLKSRNVPSKRRGAIQKAIAAA